MARQFRPAVIALAFVIGLVAAATGATVHASLFPGDSITHNNCDYSPSGTKALCMHTYSFSFGDALDFNNGGSWCGGAYSGWYSIFDGSYSCGGRGSHSSQVVGASATGEADMQSDGNFVLYSAPSGSSRWSTNTGGHTNNPEIDPQDDGNLVVYENGTPIWSLF